jgi:hypothetical protein
MKYLYVNAKDKRGMPTINLFHSEPTDEPNGLEIYFSCKLEDCSKFKDKAENILKWLPLEFEVECEGDFALPKWDYSYHGDSWKLREDHADPRVIMGGVSYPIDSKHFSDQDKTQNSSWYRHYDKTRIVQILQLGLELHLDMGSVEFTTSREQLRYTEDTIAYLKAVLEDIATELQMKVEQEIQTANSYWEACTKYEKLFASGGQFHGIKSVFKAENFMWNDLPLKQIIQLDSVVLQKAGLHVTKLTYTSGGKSKKLKHCTRVDVNSRAVFMVADMDRGNYVASNSHVLNNGIYGEGQPVYLINMDSSVVTTDMAIQSFVTMTGIPKELIVKCSSVPREPKSSSGNTAVKKVNVFALRDTSSHGRSYAKGHWEEIQVDFNAGGIFVEINRWKAKIHERFDSPDTLYTITDGLYLLRVESPVVVGVKSTVIDKYKNAKQWISFADWAKVEFARVVTEEVLQSFRVIESSSNNHSSTYTKLTRILSNTKRTFENPTSLAKKLLDSVDIEDKLKAEIKLSIDNVNNIKAAMSKVGVSLPVAKPDSVESLGGEVDKKYPLLGHLAIWECDADVSKALVDYIDLIDSKP